MRRSPRGSPNAPSTPEWVAALDADGAAGGVLLAEDRIVAVLDADHPLAAQQEVTLQELFDDPFLLSGGGCEPLLRRLYALAGCAFEPARRVQDIDTLLALVHEQVGATVVPELAIPSRHGLVCVPVVPAARRQLHLVPAAPDDVPEPVRALLDVAGRARPVAVLTRRSAARRRPSRTAAESGVGRSEWAAEAGSRGQVGDPSVAGAWALGMVLGPASVRAEQCWHGGSTAAQTILLERTPSGRCLRP